MLLKNGFVDLVILSFGVSRDDIAFMGISARFMDAGFPIFIIFLVPVVFSFLSSLLQVHYPDQKYSIPIVKVQVASTRETVKYIVSRLREDSHMRILGVTSCWHLRRSMALLQHYGDEDAERCKLTDSGYRVDFDSNGASVSLTSEPKIFLKYSFYEHFLQVWSEFSKYVITHCLVFLGAEPF